MRQLQSLIVPILIAVLVSACAAGRAFRRGEERSRTGDWDAAVAYYRQAVQADPDRPEYRIGLERAMINASRIHFDNARQFEAKDQLDAALLEYRRTTEFDPTNRQAAQKVIQLEQTIRDRLEAARPRPPIEELRQQVRQAAAEPLLNPASREPLDVRFTQTGVRDILNFISNATGINVTFDAGFQDRPYTVNLSGVTLEQALNQILTANTLFYKVMDQRTIMVIADTPANRLRFEEQVIRMFPISHADATDLAALLTQVARVATQPVQPVIQANKAANTILVRATTAVMGIIEEVILRNDKPRAEITVDVEILEVNRTRAKQYGLNLTDYQINGIFSPEVAPPGAAGAAAGGTGTGTTTQSLFNLNTISQGVSTADFYLGVPQALVKFLESDSQTRILAKPNLRGAEGTPLTLRLGSDEPYLTTSFTPLGAGGASFNPLASYQYRTVGINLQVQARVTDEGDIILDVTVESSTLGPARILGDTTAPSFGNRTVTTRMRLRDGESNLLAGLLREDERRNISGIPGVIYIPFLKEIAAFNDNQIAQTDIVMLLTPRIIRTHELTARDLSPIYVGTNQNFGLGGPPPLIAAPPEPEPAPATPPGVAPPVPPQGTPVPTVPPGGPAGQVTTPVPQAGALPPPRTATTQPPPPAAPGGQPALPEPKPAAPTPAVPPQPPQATMLAPPAQVSVTAPVGDVRVAGGPYIVPIYITGVSRVSTVALTLSFNPMAFRVRIVQEGSFLRQGAANVVFEQKVDATIGRIDLTLVRTNDSIGASGSGLIASIVFDAIGLGTTPLTLSGLATDSGGMPLLLQFLSSSVTVR